MSYTDPALPPAGTDVESAVLAAIDDDETAALLAAFIAIDTQNPPGDESALAADLARRFVDAGMDAKVTEVLPGRANVEVRLGRGRGRRLVINAHTDTMPAGVGWSRPPLEPVVVADVMLGRGACDVKGGLAAAIEALFAIRRSGVQLAGEVVLDAVVDEEDEGRGTAATIKGGRTADWAIVLEPTDLVVLPEGNGQVNFEVMFSGIAAHGSTPEAGRNAIADAAAFVGLVEDEARRLADFPHPTIGPATYNVGMIAGGVQTSIVPAACRVTVDRRISPGQTVDDAVLDVDRILTRLRALRPGVDARSQVLVAIPAIAQPEDLPVSAVLRAAVTDVTGVDHGIGGLRATSDAAQLVSAGIPSVVFGPGSIHLSAHRPDEFVPLSELHAATRALALTVVRLVGVDR